MNPRLTANLVDAGISVVGSLGAGAGTAAIKVSTSMATDAAAQGMNVGQILNAWDKGSKALNTADYIALGGESTTALQKAAFIEAGVDAAGSAYVLTTTAAQNLWTSLKLIGTGLTPSADIAAGVLGASGASANFYIQQDSTGKYYKKKNP